ncbi:MAG: hypothetical protein HZB85_10865 [Deltaproteobacteria bacterium]|nr:hypothetical protein [Deltaproteobacteria bacterium]
MGINIKAYVIGLTGAAMLFAVAPSYAADPGPQGGQMMGGKMMDEKMMDSGHEGPYKPMHEIMGMVREMMVMMKDLNHQLTPEQKTKLEGMIVRFDEISKEHEEYMKKMKERHEKKREMMDEKREMRRDKKEMMK